VDINKQLAFNAFLMKYLSWWVWKELSANFSWSPYQKGCLIMSWNFTVIVSGFKMRYRRHFSEQLIFFLTNYWVRQQFIETAMHWMAFSSNGRKFIECTNSKNCKQNFSRFYRSKVIYDLVRVSRNEMAKMLYPWLPLLEATFPYKYSNPSLTTHLSGANPA
jgi:hypothetical protein